MLGLIFLIVLVSYTIGLGMGMLVAWLYRRRPILWKKQIGASTVVGECHFTNCGPITWDELRQQFGGDAVESRKEALRRNSDGL